MSSLKFPLSDKEAKDLKIKKNATDNKNALFPTRLRELRAKKRTPEGEIITQQVLAEEIGVTKSTISLYEMGDNVPDAKTIVKIAGYYHVSTDYLLGRIDVKSPEIDNMAIHQKTGLSNEAIDKLHIWKQNTVFEFSKGNVRDTVLLPEGEGFDTIEKEGGENIKTLFKYNFLKTVDILIKSEIGIIEDISKFLFDEYSTSDTGHFFGLHKKGQVLEEALAASDLNAIFLLKAQAKLLALKNELAKESE